MHTRAIIAVAFGILAIFLLETLAVLAWG
jgi:hypothetical protein